VLGGPLEDKLGTAAVLVCCDNVSHVRWSKTGTSLNRPRIFCVRVKDSFCVMGKDLVYVIHKHKKIA
jgi:predicted protein tyrosine phosphatase